ncbi:gluconate 5-dehydrogenase [Vibrio litoralis]|uniref:gluconate 5-dehydrogenase n=1 Tax=Vibrio litoralis TaxID=335972 RepID=UPI00041B07E4|nr:gluconate 5-dehydrogenase [Vibrio litoralis]
MNNLFDLKGKVALVTGSAQGIGNVLVKGLAEHGATVVINDRTEERAKSAALQLRELGYEAYGYGFDVTCKDAIVDSVAQISKEVGPIDILINNAGIQRRFPILEFPESDWDDVIEVNQKAVFLMIQEVGKYMVKNGRGKIINIGSMQSELGRDTITPYAASKGAVKMLTRGACVELARYNVQVNCICPGYIKTELTEKLVNDHEFSAWLCNRTPANRWGEPSELVGAAVYLASDASNFVNGHAIFVDGGMLAAV